MSKEPESMLAHMFREKGKIIVHVHSLTALSIVCFASSSVCESVFRTVQSFFLICRCMG